MDIDILSGLIRDIIMERDSVTLPSLGVFYAEMVGASFSDKGYSITPPYRRLSFRQRSEDEDNALVRLYAQRCSEGLSQEEAELKRADVEREVAGFMEGLKDVLLREKMVVFPGLGRLRATKENHIFFVPDEDLDIYPEGFGLEKVSLKSLAAEGTVITPIAAADRAAEPGPGSGSDAEETVMTAQPGSGSAAESTAAQPGTETEAEETVMEREYIEPGNAAAEARIAEEYADWEASEEARMAQELSEEEAAEEARNTRNMAVLKAIVATLSVAAVLAGALAILGRTCPQIIDPLLYTQEEIAIINHPDA